MKNDIQQMLDTLVDDKRSDEFYLPISKKTSSSFKRWILENTLYNNPELNAETLYMVCLANWAYNGVEAGHIVDGKIGKLVEYIPAHDLCIYKIGTEEQFRFILMHKSGESILAYINLSIKNKTLIIHNMWYQFYDLNNGYIKLFLEKWFIPKYNLDISDVDLTKLLKNKLYI